MEAFHYLNQALHCEQLPLKQLAREQGTPLYIYSRQLLEENYRAFDQAFAALPHLVCYAVKANSNLSILKLFHDLGSGFDIVSGGELFRVRQVESDPQKIVFSGVGKRISEIDYGLKTNILLFNVESWGELEVIQARAKSLNQTARIAFRINPNVDPQTHRHIATGLGEHKFGVPAEETISLYQQARTLSHVEITGISCHVGSQLTSLAPFVDAAQKILTLVRELEALGIALKYIDLGGGLGVRYRDESPPTRRDYAQTLAGCLEGSGKVLILEPGRTLAADAGVLLTEVLYLKKSQERQFVIVDAGMNDLIRPGLYDAFHEIRPVEQTTAPSMAADVVGPVCETTDFLARQRDLPAVAPGALLAIMDAGAYGFSLSSNYNSRPRPAEVLVHSGNYQVIRKRESYEDLIRGERRS
ncbi:MAG: diaminopimelate decarboxylase [Acidobacteriota bacterium]